MSAPRDVWIDTDPAAGLPERDVDDALALIQAFRSPELRVRGVSVVYGNAALADALPIARAIVTRFGPPGLAVHAGAAGAHELRADTAAARALATGLRERPLTILALGPLTTVAGVVARRPDLHHRIHAIVMVAGRRPGQRFLSSPLQREAFPDFNFESDPAAVAAILATAIPLVLAPWEVASHLWITADDLARLAARGASGAWIAERSRSWLALWRRMVGVDGFNPFDTLAIAWATHPSLLAAAEGAVAIAERPFAGAPPAHAPRGARQQASLLVDLERPGGRRALYCYKPKPELKPILLERLARGECA
jgi:pyrimidine-specific ribonucleoside hydrolase